jgi:Ca2+-binding RTX toxin-like protein
MASPSRNYLDTTRVSSINAGLATGLIFGDKWGSSSVGAGAHITWSVPQGTSWFANSYSIYGENTNWYEFSATEIQAATMAMGAWTSISGLTSSRVDDSQGTVGEIRFAKTGHGPAGSDGHAYMPADVPRSGDVWMNVNAWNAGGNDANRPGTYAYYALLHEVGHTLGLKHPFETSIYNSNRLPEKYNHYFSTIMSYSTTPWSASVTADFYPTTPMYLDIQAIQHLYGRDTRTNAGNTTYTFSSGQKYWQTIDDASGTDTMVYRGSTASIIDLRSGWYSSVGDAINFSDGTSTRESVCIGPNVVIENAVGGDGSDRLIGNSARNILKGGSGSDTLTGAAGNDKLYGGADDDRLAGGAGQDTFYFNSPLSNAPSASNIDRVTDFNTDSDLIHLEDTIFQGIRKGKMHKSAFTTGTAAKDSNDRIIYDKHSGDLFYDQDGTGSLAQIKFAVLNRNLKLSAADFHIV